MLDHFHGITMIALIQAGGAGTRLRAITGDDLPKPMVRISGKPILQWQIENLKASGVTEIILVISSDGESIQKFFGDGTAYGVHLRYIEETEPLGTGGALALLGQHFSEDFILLFGDLMLNVDWQKFIAFHQQKNAIITAFAHPNGHPFDSDLLITDTDDRITRIDSKSNLRNYYYENLTNAGLYIVDKSVLKYVSSPVKIDFEKVVLAHYVEERTAYAYRSSEYVKDCGTPERFYAVSSDAQQGIIAAKNLTNKQKCIFLDRDGTINRFGDFVTRADMLVLMPDAAESIKTINSSPYLCICVTNQPVVARGETSFEELRNIHNRMEDLLGEQGAYLNDLFFCPHHPDKGFPGEIPELKIDCDCRKPKIGLLKRAQERYNIDFASSWMVGDTKQDVQTGINAGCRTVLLTCGDPNYDKKYSDANPTFTAKSLKDAISTILKMN
jgi:mannose-1-phosphate guanylyltransferase / phosphomannomutase